MEHEIKIKCPYCDDEFSIHTSEPTSVEDLNADAFPDGFLLDGDGWVCYDCAKKHELVSGKNFVCDECFETLDWNYECPNCSE